MHSIGYELKRLRKDSKYTQKEVCVELNISIQALSMYENNGMIPGEEVLNRLCELYGADINAVKRNCNFNAKNIEAAKKAIMRCIENCTSTNEVEDIKNTIINFIKAQTIVNHI